jgi:microcystin-dependent protein
MSNPYVGEIRMFAGNFPPVGWSLCQGQLLPISGNDTLFQLIGTTYGGDGQSTFALPDLTSRTPRHIGQSSGTSPVLLGEKAGVEQVTLTQTQMPAHSHTIVADGNNATTGVPTNAYFASSPPNNLYTVPTGPNAINPDPPNWRNFNNAMLPSQGGSQPHDNLQPYLALNFIISLFGVFPSPT